MERKTITITSSAYRDPGEELAFINMEFNECIFSDVLIKLVEDIDFNNCIFTNVTITTAVNCSFIGCVFAQTSIAHMNNSRISYRIMT